ncbi:putative amidoligase enzyme-domain-containing protein [Xylariaceae sp. FL0594]|nr:putative amidoligase enzyme-domain-containing protein [Xylariaceae sp. FL0594]
MSSTTTALTPANLSFGVEIEFLVAVLRAGMSDPHEDVEGLPPVIRLTEQDRDLYPEEVRDMAQQKVRDVIEECFSGLPTTSFIREVGEDDEYRFWCVDDDVSVRKEGDDYYMYCGMEVNSPAEYATPPAFEALCLAIATVTSKFRCLVNETCGLHVHVGLGRERLALNHIRRVAALSYAAEPLLFSLHEPARVRNTYSLPLRLSSPLSDMYHYCKTEAMRPEPGHDTSPDLSGCYQILGSSLRHGEAPLSARECFGFELESQAFLRTRMPGHFEPFHEDGAAEHRHTFSGDVSEEVELRIALQEMRLEAEGASSATAADDEDADAGLLLRQMPHIQLPLYAELDRYVSDHPAEASDVHGVRELRDSFRARLLHRQHDEPPEEPVGDQLRGYDCLSLRMPEKNRTVEVRMAAGSLDGEWVATWARICVGLFRFALYVPPGKFIDVLTRCEQAVQGKGSPYDVLDLLNDLGLFAEAVIAEKRLLQNKESWNLEFI